jgi:hypothetical protein
VDKHAADSNAAQQQDVLREGEIGLTVDRGSAELHDDRLSGKLTNVGQGFDEDPRRLSRGHLNSRVLVGVHDVLLFSLM